MNNYNLLIKVLDNKPILEDMNREHLELLYKHITYELKKRIKDERILKTTRQVR